MVPACNRCRVHLSSAAVMGSHPLIYVTLSLLEALLLTLLLTAMARARLFLQYPWFTAYVVVDIAQQLVSLICLQISYTAFFYSDWVLGGATQLLTLAVVYEVFRTALMDSEVLRVNRTNFLMLGAVVMIGAALISGWQVHGKETSSLMLARLTVSGTVRIMQITLFILVALISVFFGFYWRKFAYGIATGYGAYAVFQLVLVYFRARNGGMWHSMYALNGKMAFLCTVLIWIVFAMLDDPTMGAGSASHLSDRLRELSEKVPQN
jgi:hypothetical protein